MGKRDKTGIEEAGNGSARKSKKVKRSEETTSVAEDPELECEEQPFSSEKKKKKKRSSDEAVAAAQTEEDQAEGETGAQDDDAHARKQKKSKKQKLDDEDGSGTRSSAKSSPEEADAAATDAQKASEEKDGYKERKGKFDESKTVFVRNLPRETTEDALSSDFGECGEMISCRMVYNGDGSCKGIAFVTYATQACCDKALSYNGTDYGGRTIYVVMAGDRAQKGKDGRGEGRECTDNTICIRGLPFATTQESLKKDFEECGEVMSCRVLLNDEGSCKGIAFIRYKTKESCDKAIEFDNTDYGGRTILVAMAGQGGGKAKGGKEKGSGGKGKGKQDGAKSKGGKGKAKASKGPPPKHTGAMVQSTGVRTAFDNSESE
eukprot:TRINITY_DN65593_c0_g1_i1.p1 TRINITY_DN65593_c0_g1~~TRINITY_DN65593_c0_g1_i1.p1  ORF type:complete len:376 (+),score=77.72 TRINITY_DN65593_c0_g1_i1:86-1213(+)